MVFTSATSVVCWPWLPDFSPSGTQLFTASADGTAKLWMAEGGELLQTLTGHTARVCSARFSPSGTQLVTASIDRTAKLWTNQRAVMEEGVPEGSRTEGVVP